MMDRGTQRNARRYARNTILEDRFDSVSATSLYSTLADMRGRRATMNKTKRVVSNLLAAAQCRRAGLAFPASMGNIRPQLLAAASVIAFLGASVPLGAQTSQVVPAEENLRQEPNGAVPGKRLATVFQNTPVEIVGRRGQWREVTLEGWVWSQSVRSSTRDGFNLVVAKQGGENLRDRPNGRILARLLQGFLLERVGQQGGWTRVRRTAWIWGPSLGGPAVASSGDAPPITRAAEAVEPAAGDPPGGLSNRLAVGSSGAYLMVSPDGDTLGTLRPGTDLQVLAREGNWARVRLDAWVWTPAFLTEEADMGQAVLSASDLRANPETYAGRTVQWEVQYVALEQADAVRTDFYEGEYFILARAPDPSDGFVYLALPPELIPAVEKIRPLQTLRVLARVRTGSSAQMGNPILDVLTIE